MAEEPVGPDAHSPFLPMPHPTPGPGKHRLRVPHRLPVTSATVRAFCSLGAVLSTYKFISSSNDVGATIVGIL